MIIILQFCASITACTEHADYYESEDLSSLFNIEFKLVSELNLSKLNPEVEFFRLRRYIDIDNKYRRFLLVDDEAKVLHLIDMNGELVSSMGGIGRGPKEFININSFGIDNSGNIIAYDASQDLIKIFNSTGDLIKVNQGLLSDGLFNRSDRITAYSDKMIFSVVESEYNNQSDFWRSAKVAIYDYDGNLILLMGSHHPKVRSKDMLYKFSYHVLDLHQERIYLSQRVDYRILAFELGSSNPDLIFGRIPEHYLIWEDEAKTTETIEERRTKNVNQSFSNIPFVCGDYIIFNYMNMTDDFYISRSHYRTDFYFSIYRKNTYNYIGTHHFQNIIPMAVTDQCEVVVLLDEDPDNITLGIKEMEISQIRDYYSGH